MIISGNDNSRLKKNQDVGSSESYTSDKQAGSHLVNIENNYPLESNSHSVIEEDKKIVRELESNKKQKIRIKTRFVCFNSSEISKEQFDNFARDLCRDVCNPSLLDPLFSLMPINFTSFRDIDIEHHNEWWRRFYGGAYYSVSIMKYTRVKGLDIVAIYKTETKDKRVVEIFVDKLGNVWETAEIVMRNVTSIIYLIIKIALVTILAGLIVTLEMRYKISTFLATVIVNLWEKYKYTKEICKQMINTKSV